LKRFTADHTVGLAIDTVVLSVHLSVWRCAMWHLGSV